MGSEAFFLSVGEKKKFNEGPALQMRNMLMSANSLFGASLQCHFVIAKGV